MLGKEYDCVITKTSRGGDGVARIEGARSLHRRSEARRQGKSKDHSGAHGSQRAKWLQSSKFSHRTHSPVDES